MTDHVTAGVEPRFRIRCGAACTRRPVLRYRSRVLSAMEMFDRQTLKSATIVLKCTVSETAYNSAWPSLRG